MLVVSATMLGNAPQQPRTTAPRGASGPLPCLDAPAANERCCPLARRTGACPAPACAAPAGTPRPVRSMDKLFDLMVMGAKYQLLCCTRLQELMQASHSGAATLPCVLPNAAAPGTCGLSASSTNAALRPAFARLRGCCALQVVLQHLAGVKAILVAFTTPDQKQQGQPPAVGLIEHAGEQQWLGPACASPGWLLSWHRPSTGSLAAACRLSAQLAWALNGLACGCLQAGPPLM
jgi:hypothetical protein